MGTIHDTGQSATTPERINSVLRELLKDGKAEVSDLHIRDIARLHGELGWEGEPRFEFAADGVFLSPPGRKRRARTTQPAAQAPSGNGGQS